jgi:benzil reductase ((S)-benzoin forming)
MNFVDPNTIEPAMREVASIISATKADSVTLINNAAVTTPIGLLKDLPTNEIQEGFMVNLITPTILSKAFISNFEKSTFKKRIIHISSGAADLNLPGSNLYCIAKAALEMLVKSLHSESQFLVSPVEAIAFRPGIFESDMQTQLRTSSKDKLPTVDMYRDFKEQNLLLPPEVVAKVLTEKLIGGTVESGRVYSLSEFIS